MGEIVSFQEAFRQVLPSPDGHLKIPHLWPGQIPHPQTAERL